MTKSPLKGRKEHLSSSAIAPIELLFLPPSNGLAASCGLSRRLWRTPEPALPSTETYSDMYIQTNGSAAQSCLITGLRAAEKSRPDNFDNY